MLIIGLMVIALICLAVGLVLPSAAWLVASLIATAGAGYLVWKMRSAIAPVGQGSAAAPAAPDDPPARDAGVATDETGVNAGPDADVDAGPDAVVLVPRGARDAGTAVIGALAPAIGADSDATQVIPTVPAADAGDVWVIDGRPRYHLGDCPIIQGQDAEPIPFEQAVEDGFMPCSLCEPNMARTTS